MFHLLPNTLFPDVDCGDPGTPTNGQRTLSSTTYTSVVTYTCDAVYTLQGSNTRTCQSNGEWSGSVPQCLCEFLLIRVACTLVHIDTLSMLLLIPPLYIALCSSPCQNGGTCTGVDTCACATGYGGSLCETGLLLSLFSFLLIFL